MPETGIIDEGLLEPVAVGSDAIVSDAAVVDALVAAEVALARAWGRLGVAPARAVDEIADVLGWAGPGAPARGHGVDIGRLAADAVAGGNPVIPLVDALRARFEDPAKAWIHRGATSQDILDTALMLTAARAVAEIREHLGTLSAALRALAGAHRDTVAAARTLTQHAVPTTVGLRVAAWLRGVARADERLARLTLPAQLGGAGGTLAAFVEIAGSEIAAQVPAAFAVELGLAVPDAPWHTTRWPVTELADALVQTVDAVGVMATDTATLGRTEIAELLEAAGGGSSAMPQKQNPAASVLIRSAALRAPHLGATLHTAAALAGDERPDGAWHAEWPALRALLRLALGATRSTTLMAEGLRVQKAAVSRNLGLTDARIVSERLSIALAPLIGGERARELIASASGRAELAALLRALPEAVDVDALLDPAGYTGLAGQLVDEAVTASLGGPAAGENLS
ncbi:MAG: lyase family protein [Microbacterium sp.]|uniref:lyase family protein n=1 Tax=Microbacterium sp. TaxID=51671 RepID=UPI0039E3675B